MGTERKDNGAVRDMTDFLNALPHGWKAIMALLGAVSFGLTGGFLLVGFSDLPNQVASNSAAIRANAAAIEEVERHLAAFEKHMETIVCLITLPDGLMPEEMIRSCEV